MSMPTIPGIPPDTWEQILQILNQMGLTVKDLSEMGITSWEGAGGLKEYLLNNGWELKEVWDLKQMWFHTGAADPTQTNALVQYVANNVAVAGAAGSQYVTHFTYGGSTMGRLKKGVVFGTIFALLVSSLNPTFIVDALKGRLGAVIDRFADKNGDVPVIVGKDGKTYYHEEMVNALRQALIDEGAYSTDPMPSGAYIIDGVTQDSSTWSNAKFYKMPVSYYRPNNVNEYRLEKVYITIGGNEIDITDRVTCFNTSYNKRHDIYLFADLSDYYDQLDSTAQYRISGLYDGHADSYVVTGKIHINKDITVEHNNETRTLRAYIYKDYGGYAEGTSTRPFTNVNPNIIPAYLTFGAQGVRGITVASDLIQRGIGDISTSLENVFPSYATDKITTINPTDEDITASDNWYPISSSDNDVWTDGITEQQSETATDGEVTPDVQSQIAEAIKQILKDYYRDPTDPGIINYPEIPAGDSGDTPPAEPPLISGSANGLWSIYNPTLQQVQAFGAYLWSESILDQITRMFNSPIDAVIGFHMIYCTPIKGPAKNIKCGYLDTGVSSITVANQYVTIDCGTIEVPEYYRTALDYAATKLALYLPFIGIIPLSTAVCMGATLQVIYRIDVLTGTCLAQVKVIKENSDAVMYAFEGNCSVQIPLTATTYTGIASALINTVSAGLSVFMGDYISAAGDAGSAISAGMTNLSGTKQSGQMGANAGALGIRIPYLIITHPVSYDALQYNTQYGYPLNQTISLGSVTGYTRVKDIHLAGIPCTDDELEMIERLLKDGVIIN